VIKFGKPVPADVDARLPGLVRRLSDDARVAAVWLFGSRARGEADALSDVDLAVLAAGTPARSELATWELEWLRVANGVLQTDEVSIVVLNHAPLVLRHEVLRGARLLFARSPEIAADYELATIQTFLDFCAHLEEYDRELLARAASGHLR
jgi:predicted nucleotidyltransferase